MERGECLLSVSLQEKARRKTRTKNSWTCREKKDDDYSDKAPKLSMLDRWFPAIRVEGVFIRGLVLLPRLENYGRGI